MHAAAAAGILALRILAHDDPIEFRAGDVAQRADDAGQYARGADVGVLIERLADRQPQAPQTDMVRDVGRSDRAEIDGVVTFDLIAAVDRHHQPGGAIIVRSPVEAIAGEFEAALGSSQGREDFDSGWDDLLADAVAGDDRDSITPHGSFPVFCVVLRPNAKEVESSGVSRAMRWRAETGYRPIGVTRAGNSKVMAAV